MAAKRSPTLSPPPADGAALHARFELRVRIPGDLVGRLCQLAHDDNRSIKQEAEWLLWGAIRSEPLASESEQPVPYTVMPFPGPAEADGAR